MERFDTHHRHCDALDETMVLLDTIVQIFALHNLDQSPITGKFADYNDRLKFDQIASTEP